MQAQTLSSLERAPQSRPHIPPIRGALILRAEPCAPASHLAARGAPRGREDLQARAPHARHAKKAGVSA